MELSCGAKTSTNETWPFICRARCCPRDNKSSLINNTFITFLRWHHCPCHYSQETIINQSKHCHRRRSAITTVIGNCRSSATRLNCVFPSSRAVLGNESFWGRRAAAAAIIARCHSIDLLPRGSMSSLGEIYFRRQISLLSNQTASTYNRRQPSESFTDGERELIGTLYYIIFHAKWSSAAMVGAV